MNLFVPASTEVDKTVFRGYAVELQLKADSYGLQLDASPVTDDDHWDDKLAFLLDQAGSHGLLDLRPARPG